MAGAPRAPWGCSSSSACGSGSSACTRNSTASPHDGTARCGRSATQCPGQPRPLIDNTVLEQPGARVGCILLEPGGGAAQAKAVTPLVHVGTNLLARHPGQGVGHQDLQVAHRAFLGILAA